MNPSENPHSSPAAPAAVDEDLIAQARPGEGIPSQDTSLSAQLPLKGEDAEREANSAWVGGAAIAGAATGAAVGVTVAGPVGVVVGATLGLVAGALGGAAAGSTAVEHADPVAKVAAANKAAPG
ncbi:bacteriocin [Paucibacter sp. B2R-40]|uniref:bacteriocin n=1 Tax=Paucibacter sp. B2R-40 TaxID=2893554 RepID=UPI0021E3B8D3|nr:bacteriocin [Paucibacter sp. B2R-40]MCV2352574.1 bacteriocin [Paucibacter sp. B2R-40]